VPAGPRAESAVFHSLHDPYLLDFLRTGAATSSGAVVTPTAALRNTTVFRCCSLISYAIGMLPLHLLRGDDFDSDKDTDHPLYEVLYAEPNGWQTAFDFRSHMQLRALTDGDAYARVIRSRGQIRALIPIPEQVEPDLDEAWRLSYKVKGSDRRLSPEDVLHVRGLSFNGLTGMSLVRQAAEAIGLAQRTEEAAARLFRNGMLVGGAITHPQRLGPEALANLRDSLEARYAGVENAHRWLVFEEGMKPEKFGDSAADNQHLETRKHQIEEIGRIFGVPRPLLGVDDTSWGSGIEQLGIGFVRYGLNQWFTAWEQAIRRTLLTRDEKRTHKAKFNEGALLRGSMKDQAEFFAKALGSGGHQPWMHVDEVRGLSNLRRRDDLPPPAGQTPPEDTPDDPPQAA
jgi:HK97 family phage portal protein